jgi:hypothetical protein
MNIRNLREKQNEIFLITQEYNFLTHNILKKLKRL